VLFAIVASVLGYWAWQASVQQQALTLEVLRGHGQLAAQRFGARVGSDLSAAATYVFRSLEGRATQKSVEPAAILEAAAKLRACRCAPPIEIAYGFRAAAAESFESAGPVAPTEGERQWLWQTLAQNADSLAADWDVAIAPGGQALGSRIAFFTRARNAAGERVIYGFTAETTAVAQAVFRPLLSSMRRLPGDSRTRYDSLFAFRVEDAEGRVLYETAERPRPELSARIASLPAWGSFVVFAAIRPTKESFVRAGGIPPSPVAVLLVLLAITGALFFVGALLLWRVHEIGRLRRDFTSSVSHELRTPLTQILLFAETIELRKNRPHADNVKAAAIISREARRLIHLVENVLQFARAERHDTRLHKGEQALASVAADAIEAFEPVAAQQRTQIVLRRHTEPIVSIDTDAFRLILINLLDNAVRYGPHAQTVVVDVEERDGWGRVSVDDEGPGVPANMRERIWRPFVRAERRDDVEPRAQSGTGIGLAIVRELVTLHGGRYGLEPSHRRRDDARGARFFVEVPLVVASTVNDHSRDVVAEAHRG
jgi:signal transduction histidine kinase